MRGTEWTLGAARQEQPLRGAGDLKRAAGCRCASGTTGTTARDCYGHLRGDTEAGRRPRKGRREQGVAMPARPNAQRIPCRPLRHEYLPERTGARAWLRLAGDAYACTNAWIHQGHVHQGHDAYMIRMEEYTCMLTTERSMLQPQREACCIPIVHDVRRRLLASFLCLSAPPLYESRPLACSHPGLCFQPHGA